MPAPKPTLLLVDDMPQNLQVLASNLADEYELAFASDGFQALEMVNEQSPDLILLDVMMPGIDGFEVCRRLKKMPIKAGIPVIFLTARTDTDDVVKGFEVGGVDYITKPFQPAELRVRVNNHIQLHQLKKLMAVCSYCNNIRNENEEWERLDSYVHRKAGTPVTHGICPTCYKRVIKELDTMV